MSKQDLRKEATIYFDSWKNSSSWIQSLLNDIEHNYKIDSAVKELMMQSFVTGIEYGVDLVTKSQEKR